MKAWTILTVVVLGLAACHVSARELKKTVTPPMCPSMGVTTAVSKAPLPSCKTLYPTGAAIRVPKDCPTYKYGAVWLELSTFVDRNGREYSFNPKVLPKTLVIPPESFMYGSQLVVVATFNTRGNITALKPVLFVEEAAYIKPFMKTKFVGAVNNLLPPAGVATSQYIRWDFGSTWSNYELGSTTVQALSGQFTNYFSGVSSAKNASVCEPALCGTDAQRTWYTEFFGNGTAMQLYWNPAMHFSGDSEFVPSFSSGITYMSGAPRPYELLVSNIDLSKTYTFVIHGTPVFTPQNFTGKFSKQLTAPKLC